jgi:predicted nuclease of predicted toxin-antitoxin system
MRTLYSELGAAIDQRPGSPRVYADANVPAGLVAFMRRALGWDVFYVMEEADLRRAPDTEHYRLARQLHRTLVTLDRDYFDDRRFPPQESGGVVVISAPDERQLTRVLRRVDAVLLRKAGEPLAGEPSGAATSAAPPLAGRKLHAHPDWPPPHGGTACR